MTSLGSPRAATGVAVTGLVLSALVLRIWGSFIGLPHEYLPDERSKIETATRMHELRFQHGGNQPGFLPMSLWAIYGALQPAQPHLKTLSLPADHSLDGDGEFPARLWIARVWLDVLSTVTVLCVFCVAARLAGLYAGWIAAALLAANPIAIASANYVKEDTPVTLWLTAVVWTSLELARRRTGASALLAGACAGLAIGSKYTGAFAVLLVAMVLFGRSASLSVSLSKSLGQGKEYEPPSGAERGAARLAAFALVGAAIALVLTTPAMLLAPTSILRGILYQATYAAEGHHDRIALPIADTWGLFYLRRALVPSLGVPAVASAVAGLIALWCRDRLLGSLMALSSIGFLAVIEALPAKPYPFFGRYALPVIAMACVLAGVGCAFAVSIAGRRGARRGVLTIALAIVVTIVPVARTVRFVRGMYPDTRDRAARWILENVPERSWVIETAYSPAFPPGYFKTWPIGDQVSVKKILEQRPEAKVVVLSDFATSRFVENPDDNPERAAFYAWLVEEGREIARFSADGASYGFYNPSIVVREVRPINVSAGDQDHLSASDATTKSPP